MHGHSEVRTYLFTDIEGSTRMWEENPDGMRPALARHDALTRAAIEGNRGTLVKRTGDGIHAVFNDPADALAATLQMQLALADAQATAGVQLSIRCGLHAGADEPRDGDFYGTAVNRAARIMGTAHGGQVVFSQAVMELLAGRLPAQASTKELGTVRLRDLASPERLYQLLHPKLRDQFPALRSLEATPNNLPQQLTSFVGREAELAEVKKLVGESRLLTLLGMGGMGKSRLSLQAGAEMIDEFPDGVWLVELAQVKDPRLVPQAVASVLGVKESAGRPVLEALVKFFRERRLLLILDNCEHLLAACAELARDLLKAGRHSKVLASSREPLRIAGEATFPIPALPASEAERLFVERARAAKPGFRLNGSANAVSSLCRHLDGIPLAIELAAARVRTLSPDAIDARLNDRFRLLTRGDRAALPRQQTLRALIDWSHDLLSEEERAVFRRLAVFAGGWSLAGAEAVTAFSGLDPVEVMDHVSDLAEKSLVTVDAGEDRYRYLETVREYAWEKLLAAGEEAEARQRHLKHYLAFIETARHELSGPDQGKWLARMDLERENLLAAHAWCDHAPDGAGLGLQLAFCFKHYWFRRGLLGLGLRVTTAALARPDPPGHPLERSRVLLAAGQFSNFMGRYAEARAWLEESLGLARALGDERRIAVVLQPLGMALHGQGDVDGAKRMFEEAVASAEKLGDQRELAASVNGLAQLHRSQGEFAEAASLYRKVLAIVRATDDREFIAIGQLNLAMVAVLAGELDQAREMLSEVAAITAELNSRSSGQSLLEVCVGLAAVRGEWQCCARFFGAAEAQAAETGLHRDPADEAFLTPLVARAQAALGPEAFARASEAGRSAGYDTAIAEATSWLRRGPASRSPRAGRGT